MTFKMSKTAAIKEAQSFCGRVRRRSSTDYVCHVPFYSDKPDGPSKEMQAVSYVKCVASRSRNVARIALHLMGAIHNEDDSVNAESAFESACRYGSVSSKDLLSAALDVISK